MLEDLLMEAGVGGGKATDELVSQLDRYHFGVVTVPDHHRENLEGMWTAIDAFFAMSGPDKKLAAGEATRIREVVGGIVGYQDHRGTNSDPSQKRFAGGNEHLDTRRVGPTGALVPSFADGAIHDQPTASELILAGRETLHAVGAAAVGAAALASGINVGELVLMIDDGSDLGEGKMTPSELRFLRYPNDAGSDGGNYVAFEPHVDTSLVTLIPVYPTPQTPSPSPLAVNSQAPPPNTAGERRAWPRGLLPLGGVGATRGGVGPHEERCLGLAWSLHPGDDKALP